jgi:hypothetical protein
MSYSAISGKASIEQQPCLVRPTMNSMTTTAKHGRTSMLKPRASELIPHRWLKINGSSDVESIRSYSTRLMKKMKEGRRDTESPPWPALATQPDEQVAAVSLGSPNNDKAGTQRTAGDALAQSAQASSSVERPVRVPNFGSQRSQDSSWRPFTGQFHFPMYTFSPRTCIPGRLVRSRVLRSGYLESHCLGIFLRNVVGATALQLRTSYLDGVFVKELVTWLVTFSYTNTIHRPVATPEHMLLLTSFAR